VDNLEFEKMEWCLKLPWPPSVNHYKKAGRLIKTRTGKTYQQRIDTSETKAFYFQVYRLCRDKMPPGWTELAENTIYSLKIYAYPPDNRKRDLDNILKVLCDSLVKAQAISDDSKIHQLYIEKCSVAQGGEVIVRIHPY
jgi:crossover junction endodeoxyribonuclease RusA